MLKKSEKNQNNIYTIDLKEFYTHKALSFPPRRNQRAMPGKAFGKTYLLICSTGSHKLLVYLPSDKDIVVIYDLCQMFHLSVFLQKNLHHV